MTHDNFNGLVALAASCLMIALAPSETFAQTVPTTAPRAPQASHPAAVDQLAIADMIAHGPGDAAGHARCHEHRNPVGFFPQPAPSSDCAADADLRHSSGLSRGAPVAVAPGA